MKAKIKPLIILIAIFAASLIAGIAAGCSIGESTPQDAANNKGMYASVTYYANGGSFSDNLICYKTMYFRPGDPIFNVGVDPRPVGGSGAQLSIKRENYNFVGWIEAELDENGLPTLLAMTEDGEITDTVLQMKENGTASMVGENGRELSEQQKRFTAKISDDPTQWNFVFEAAERPKLERDEHRYLVAAWEPDVVLDYVLVSDEAVTFELPMVDDPETEEDESLLTQEVALNSGDVIKSVDFGIAGYVTLRPGTAIAEPVSDHSYIYLFWDEECTKPATSAYGNRVERPQDGKNAKIYAKYLPGRWNTVAESSQVRDMFNMLGSSNYYVVDDIDCSSLSLSLGSRSFSGTILGNGHTISNLKFSATVNNGSTVSMFGNISATAAIKDLTIANVTATVTMRGTGYVYALFAACAEGATFEKFSVEGYSMTITRNNLTIMNIQMLADGYDTTNWLYGGYGSSDADFVSVYGEIVKNTALTIDKELIIGQEENNE